MAASSMTLRTFIRRMKELYPRALCYVRFLPDRGISAEFRGGTIGPPICVQGRYEEGAEEDTAIIDGGPALLDELEKFAAENERQIRMVNGQLPSPWEESGPTSPPATSSCCGICAEHES